MQIDEQVDHGPIIIQKEIQLEDFLGFNDLQEKLAKEGSILLADVLPLWIKGKIKPTEQNHTEATFTKKETKEAVLINMINDDQLKNYLKILAFEHWPVAYFEMEKDGKKIKVIVKKATFKENELEILRVLPEGKKEMSYADCLRGLK